MVVASHYVFKDMKRLLEVGDMERLRDTTSRYCELYSEDAELQELSGKINKYLLSGNKEALEGLRSEIIELARRRQLETSGGSILWFKGRR